VVPGVTADRLRDGFRSDQEARERLLGGSVTLSGRLVLIASLQDPGSRSALHGRWAATSTTPPSGAAGASSSERAGC
jgi:hypothetical protein